MEQVDVGRIVSWCPGWTNDFNDFDCEHVKTGSNLHIILENATDAE